MNERTNDRDIERESEKNKKNLQIQCMNRIFRYINYCQSSRRCNIFYRQHLQIYVCTYM